MHLMCSAMAALMEPLCLCGFLPHHTVQVRPPMPAVFFFVLDVTAGAVSSGMLAVACETIKGALDGLPGGERTHVGFLTFDSHLHYYNLSEAPSTIKRTELHRQQLNDARTASCHLVVPASACT